MLGMGLAGQYRSVCSAVAAVVVVITAEHTSSGRNLKYINQGIVGPEPIFKTLLGLRRTRVGGHKAN